MLCGFEKKVLRRRILAVGVGAWLAPGIAGGRPSAGAGADARFSANRNFIPPEAAGSSASYSKQAP